MVRCNMARGAFIVLEGCDRCGKTTQTEKLLKTLNSMDEKTELMQFPDRTTGIGKVIDQYLKQNSYLSDQAIHLLFSANRWEMEKEITKILKSGTNLIVDRYAFSGVAFTAAKEKKGASLEWCKQSDVGLPAPDIVLFLDLSPDDALKRGGYGDERYEKLEFQRKVYETFQKMHDKRYWITVDASQTIEEVHEKLMEESLKTIKKCSSEQIKRLWTPEE